MIGYVINYKDIEKRKTMSSGLLVTHPMTKRIVALGKSSLSGLLAKHFTDGVSVFAVGKLNISATRQSEPFDPESFEKVASIWFSKADLLFRRIDLQTPLTSFVPVALDLSAAYNGEPFEKIQIVSGVTK